MFRPVNIIFVVLVVASVSEARIKFKKMEITTDPNYLKIQYTMEERNDKPYLNIVTEILQDIDGEIIVIHFLKIFSFVSLHNIFFLYRCMVM